MKTILHFEGNEVTSVTQVSDNVTNFDVKFYPRQLSIEEMELLLNEDFNR